MPIPLLRLRGGRFIRNAKHLGDGLYIGTSLDGTKKIIGFTEDYHYAEVDADIVWTLINEVIPPNEFWEGVSNG